MVWPVLVRTVHCSAFRGSDPAAESSSGAIQLRWRASRHRVLTAAQLSECREDKWKKPPLIIWNDIHIQSDGNLLKWVQVDFIFHLITYNITHSYHFLHCIFILFHCRYYSAFSVLYFCLHLIFYYLCIIKYDILSLFLC